ncbi:hypothetical protein [Kitasatospora indigofera]|uniref:hypothetical protein n=1 Tax=Kitasatospora indigofera TaxID=67307 RepID=UPI003674CE8A
MLLHRARPGRRTFRPVVDRLPASMSGAVALGAFAALVAALAVVGELRVTWFALGAFAALCGLLGAVSRPVAAPLIAGAGWLFFNGFVVHRHATLEWGGAGAEGVRLGLFTAAALLSSLPAVLPRRTVRVQLLPVPDRVRSTHD